MFFLAEICFACHCNTPPNLFSTGLSNPFQDGDEFIVEYLVDNEMRDAKERIPAGPHNSALPKLAACYFKRENNVYVLDYAANYFAVALLAEAIRIAQDEGSNAEQISLRFFHGGSKCSRCNAFLRRKEGYSVDFGKKSLSTSNFKIVKEYNSSILRSFDNSEN
jgi:hypothetical protein